MVDDDLTERLETKFAKALYKMRFLCYNIMIDKERSGSI